MFQPHVILHPTDFSERSRQAYPLALDLARQFHARLILLHVAHPPRPGDVSYAETGTELFPEGYLHRFEEELRQHFAPPPPDVEIDFQVREGDPASEIIEATHELGCDLLVLTTHGRTGLNRLLLGSTAERILRLANCPVLTLKAP